MHFLDFLNSSRIRKLVCIRDNSDSCPTSPIDSWCLNFETLADKNSCQIYPEGPPPDYSKYDLNDCELEKLTKYDTVFVVDDSTSMNSRMASGRTRWEEACEALADFASLATHYDTDGIDIHFFNSTKMSVGLRTKASIEALFSELAPKGGTYIGRKIQQLSEPYLGMLASAASSSSCPWPKPRSYIIITDGKARDEAVLRAFLKDTAASLRQMGCPPGQLGYQFVQIGNNMGASKFLDELDGDRRLYTEDIVDTVKASSSSDPTTRFGVDFPKKVLLGGVIRNFDRTSGN